MKFHIDCKCGCDVLCIEKIIERNKNEPAIYYFNMYRSLGKGRLWYRLKCAWKYFRSGEFAWSDMTIEDKDINNLINFLNKAKSAKETN